MSEKLYDEVIAPKLLELGKLCEANGMSLVAQCEYAPGEFGRTFTLVKDAHFAIRLTEASMRAEGNVDSLYIALARYANKYGHSSMVMNLLGVRVDSSAKKA